MPRIRLTPAAREDLADIWRYTDEEWGTDQATEYTRDIDLAFRLLADEPKLCRERTEFDPPVRIYHQASHLIIYLVDDQGIVVVRILHERMDVETQLEED